MESASLSNETDVIVWEQMDWKIHEKIYHINTPQRFLALTLVYTVHHNRVNRSTHYNTKCDPRGKAVYSKVLMTDEYLEVNHFWSVQNFWVILLYVTSYITLL